MKNNIKHCALQLAELPSFPILTVRMETKKFLLFLYSDFTRCWLTKGTENTHRWDKRGVAAPGGARDSAPRPAPRQHLGNHCQPHLHPPPRRRRRALPPLQAPAPGQTLGIVRSLRRPRKARKKEKREE